MNNPNTTSDIELLKQPIGTTTSLYFSFPNDTTLAKVLDHNGMVKTPWDYRFDTVAPKSTSPNIAATFFIAPNKLSPYDKAWDIIEQFFDADEHADAIDTDDWLDDLRAGWDARLDDIYRPKTRK